MIGSGVCVFSRYPIIDAFTYRYSLNGYMYNITHGDWFGGKAAGYCLIDHPKQPIHFFSTHVSHYLKSWLIYKINNNNDNDNNNHDNSNENDNNDN